MRAAGAPLLPWQAHEITGDLDCDADGRLTYSTVLDIAPRRNGKTHKSVKARATAGALLLGEQRITYTAHHGDTVRATFDDYRRFLFSCGQSSPTRPGRLWRYVQDGNGWRGKNIRQGKGDESVTFVNGATVKFRTRTKDIGRGLECELLIIDEALEAQASHMAILTPLRAASEAQGIGQTLILSSAGHGKSQVLNEQAALGRSGANPRMSFNEHCAPEDMDPAAPETWAIANPSLGSEYLSKGFLQDQYHNLNASVDPTEFGREHLGWFSDAAGLPFVPAGAWESLRVTQAPAIVTGAPIIGVEMQRERHAAIVAAVPLEHGRIWVEPIGEIAQPHALNPEELAAQIIDTALEHGAGAIVIDDLTGETLIPHLQAGRVQVIPTSGADFRRACSLFLDMIEGRRVCHAYDSIASAEMIGATGVPAGDTLRLSRAKSTTSTVRPVATILACWGVQRPPVNRQAIVLTAQD